ncbi:MAG TPA: YceI family protein [Actinospica sp.]|jgi:polyisoprenoid-binding protein YceI|nr:YceI family protein [Actinospica sp.]
MTTELAPGRYTLDPAASTVVFRRKSLWGLVTVRGGFSSIAGTGEVAADGTGHGTLTIGAASLDTRNAQRDKHLRSKDFFEVDGFPEITFEATRIAPTGDGAAQVEGELTVRGTSSKLAMPAQVETQGTDSVVLRATVEVDQTEFGMTWNRLGIMGGHPTVLDLQLRFTAAA